MEPCDFKAEVGECGALQLFLLLRRGTCAPQKLARDGKAFTEHKIGRRSTEVGLKRCPQGKEDAGQAPKPIVGSVLPKRDEGLLEPTMKSFDHAVRFRMIRRRVVHLDAPHFDELSPYSRSKLGAPVRRDGCRDPKRGHPAMRESVYDRLGGDILDRNRHRPACESINDCEQVSKTIGKRKRDDVDVQVLETSLRHRELADLWNGMACDFRLLARDTFSGPASDVCVHGWPDELGRDSLACAFDAWMSQVVQRVEDSPSPGEWDNGSCRPIGYVHHEFGPVQINPLEVEAGVAVVDESLIVSIEGLVPGHLFQVDAHLPNGVDNVSQRRDGRLRWHLL